MGDYRNLLAYKKAFQLALDIHETTKRFPAEEKYSLTDQIRRSSRAICANFAEAYRKRRYPKNFVSKLTDADAENEETGVWLDLSLALNSITPDEHKRLYSLKEEVGRLLGDIINNPLKYS